MFHFRLQSAWLRKRAPALALSATLALFGGAMLLVALPLVRVAENNEHGSQRERVEEPTPVRRIDHDRHLRSEYGVAAFLQPTRPTLGHAQRLVLDSLPGHRLANGLLAPLTC